jgi:hypothetical protein
LRSHTLILNPKNRHIKRLSCPKASLQGMRTKNDPTQFFTLQLLFTTNNKHESCCVVSIFLHPFCKFFVFTKKTTILQGAPPLIFKKITHHCFLLCIFCTKHKIRAPQFVSPKLLFQSFKKTIANMIFLLFFVDKG